MGFFSSSSETLQTTNNSSNDEIQNAVNGDGDFNTSSTVSGLNNSVSIVSTDNGTVEEAFSFARAALDTTVASGDRANSILEGAIDVSRGEAVNSENLLKIVVTGAAIIAVAYVAVKRGL